MSLYANSLGLQKMDPSGNESISKCGSSATVPYIDPVDMVGNNPVVDNKEVIGSISASASLEQTLGSFEFPPRKCGDFVVRLDAFHTKKFNDLRAMTVVQQDAASGGCTHSFSTTQNSIHAEWSCPIRCASGKCEPFTLASIVFLTQGQGPGKIYYTRPGQMVAVYATIDFSGSCCFFGCVVEVKVCQLLGHGVPNNHTDPNPATLPQLGNTALGACERWSAPRR